MNATLDCALEASVRKLVFVHGFNAHLLQSLEGMRAKQRFVDELKDSGIEYAIVCPNGFFNDMSEFLKIAKKGTVYLIGDGQRKINPIHVADLAKVCVDAVAGRETEIPVGGRVTYTYREIAELASAVLGKPIRIRRVPEWLVKAALPPRPNVQQTVLHDSVRHRDHHAARLRGTEMWISSRGTSSVSPLTPTLLTW